MQKQNPFLLFAFLIITVFHTPLFAGMNSMTKAIVKNGELHLYFSKTLKKSDIKHFTLPNPNRQIYDFKNMRMAHKRVPLGLGKHVRIAQNNRTTVRVVIDSKNKYTPVIHATRTSYHISLGGGTYHKPVHHTEAIVIDAGHGGHDTGAIGGGKREKDLVLQIAKKVYKEFKAKGFPVYLTRSSDKFLKLGQRTRIADHKDAKVFISIHANSVARSKRYKMQGIETFFLQNTRDERSQRIAARENKAVLKGTDRVSKEVIIDSVLNGPKIVESNKLAIDIHRHMITNARTMYRDVKDGGVRHAPFYVLVGASRPSILIEVGYISHPKERKRLFNSHYQDLLSKGVVEGVEHYLDNRRKEIDF
jgi:N-acetylmuramoyl-L-alanine amidase